MDSVLKELLKNSYSPISGKKVAAVVKMKDGKTFEGVNVENPSFKSGLCAEQVAIGSAISEGYKKGDFDSIYLMDDSGEYIMPCFLCRQNFIEIFDNDTKIYSLKLDGKSKEYSLKDLCPHAFTLEDSDE